MNDKSTQMRGTMRIFLAPKFDETGKEFKFNELRLLMMEMDRFTVNREFSYLAVQIIFIFKIIFNILKFIAN